MKIVINRCYGGFGLSPVAIREYLKRKGMDCFFYDNSSFDSLIKVSGAKNSLFIYCSTKDLGERTTWEQMEGSYFNPREIPRNDIDLVEVVEILKSKASGRYSDLRVVKIPDGIEWEIDEYDGLETVEEKHRSWC